MSHRESLSICTRRNNDFENIDPLHAGWTKLLPKILAPARASVTVELSDGLPALREGAMNRQVNVFINVGRTQDVSVTTILNATMSKFIKFTMNVTDDGVSPI